MATKKNQIIIDLGKIELTPAQRKSLLKGLHSTVSKKIKAAAVVNAGVMTEKTAIPTLELDTATATLVVDFQDTDAGDSDLTATYNGEAKTIHQSGSISFDTVKSKKRIKIQGTSPGTTIVTVTGVETSPAQMSFPIGDIEGIFLIL